MSAVVETAAKPRRTMWPILAAGAVAALGAAVDRWAWADVSLWDGDSGLLLRLAAAHFTPIGVLNSRFGPNPNGLVLLADLLLWIGDLRVVSFVLSLGQAAALVWLARGLTRTWAQAIVAAQALLWSAALRAVSTDLWGQWTLLTLDTVAIAALLHHVRRPRASYFAISIGAGAGAAAAYLPGIVSLVVLAGLWTVRLSRLAPAARRHHVVRAGLPVALLFTFVTAMPFALAVDASSVASGSSRGIPRRAAHAAVQAVYALPVLLRQQAVYFPRTIRPQAPAPVRDGWWLPLAAAVAAGVAFVASPRRRTGTGLARVTYALAFAIGIFAAMPLVTGYVITRDDRPDLGFQVWPIVIAAAFGSAFLMRRSPLRRAASVVAVIAALVFAAAQARAGWALRQSLADGRLHSATPMLHEVHDIVDHLARHSGSAGTVAVEYRHDPEWFAAFRAAHRRWIDIALPAGIVFDRELERRAGIRNSCVDGCADTGDRYVVTTADAPRSKPATTSTIIGAYRVDLVRVP